MKALVSQFSLYIPREKSVFKFRKYLMEQILNLNTFLLRGNRRNNETLTGAAMFRFKLF